MANINYPQQQPSINQPKQVTEYLSDQRLTDYAKTTKEKFHNMSQKYLAVLRDDSDNQPKVKDNDLQRAEKLARHFLVDKNPQAQGAFATWLERFERREIRSIQALEEGIAYGNKCIHEMEQLVITNRGGSPLLIKQQNNDERDRAATVKKIMENGRINVSECGVSKSVAYIPKHWKFAVQKGKIDQTFDVSQLRDGVIFSGQVTLQITVPELDNRQFTVSTVNSSSGVMLDASEIKKEFDAIALNTKQKQSEETVKSEQISSLLATFGKLGDEKEKIVLSSVQSPEMVQILQKQLAVQAQIAELNGTDPTLAFGYAGLQEELQTELAKPLPPPKKETDPQLLRVAEGNRRMRELRAQEKELTDAADLASGKPQELKALQKVISILGQENQLLDENKDIAAKDSFDKVRNEINARLVTMYARMNEVNPKAEKTPESLANRGKTLLMNTFGAREVAANTYLVTFDRLPIDVSVLNAINRRLFVKLDADNGGKWKVCMESRQNAVNKIVDRDTLPAANEYNDPQGMFITNLAAGMEPYYNKLLQQLAKLNSDA